MILMDHYCRIILSNNIAGQTYKLGVRKYCVFLVIVIVKGASDCLHDTSAMNFSPEDQFLLCFDSVLFIF